MKRLDVPTAEANIDEFLTEPSFRLVSISKELLTARPEPIENHPKTPAINAKKNTTPCEYTYKCRDTGDLLHGVIEGVNFDEKNMIRCKKILTIES